MLATKRELAHRKLALPATTRISLMTEAKFVNDHLVLTRVKLLRSQQRDQRGPAPADEDQGSINSEKLLKI